MPNYDRSAWNVGGIFSAVLATTVLAAATISLAIAQTTPPAPQKPAASTKKPQKPPQQSQQPQQQQQAQMPPVVVPQLIYRRWTKVCPPKDAPNPQGQAKQPCLIFMEGREDMGSLVVRATLMDFEGETKKGFVVSFLYGVDLIRGTRVVVDQGATDAYAPYVVCVPPNVPPPFFGCVAQYEVTREFVDSMKKGKFLTLQTVFNGQTLSPQLPLADFAKAFDGPATDLAAEAAEAQKLQQELADRAKKKAEEVQKKAGQPGSK